MLLSLGGHMVMSLNSRASSTGVCNNHLHESLSPLLHGWQNQVGVELPLWHSIVAVSMSQRKQQSELAYEEFCAALHPLCTERQNADLW